MKPLLNLLHLKSYPILQQLQLEEALLRTDANNWFILNEGTPSPAIVMGISGKPELLINPTKYHSQPIPIIKRFSGGGTVFVDSDTYFTTFICNSTDLQIPPFPDKVLKWSETFYQPTFPNFKLLENDYVFNNRKFGGNAQYMTKNRWLHHSSLLWDFNPANMDYLLMPPKTPSYRQLRPHSDFLCRLCELFPNQDALTERLFRQLNQNFNVSLVSLEEASDALLRPHRKTTCKGDFVPYASG